MLIRTLIIFILLSSHLINAQQRASIVNDDTTKFVIERQILNDSIIFEHCKLELIKRMANYIDKMNIDYMALEMTNPVRLTTHSKVSRNDTIFHTNSNMIDSRMVTSYIKKLLYEQIYPIYRIYTKEGELYKYSFLIKFYGLNIICIVNDKAVITEVILY